MTPDDPKLQQRLCLIGRNELETTFLIRAAAIMQSMSIREKIKHWYEGEVIVFERERDGKSVAAAIYEYRHWTSYVSHFLVDHWRLSIGTTLVAIAIFVTACRA